MSGTQRRNPPYSKKNSENGSSRKAIAPTPLTIKGDKVPIASPDSFAGESNPELSNSAENSWLITLSWLGVFLTALYTRVVVYFPFVFVGSEIRFESGDAYLHLRRILMSVNSFPIVAGYDNYNGFPQGMLINWPPLWDFSASALSMIFGLGHPSEQMVIRVAAVFPVLIGFLVFIPLSYLVQHVFGTRAVWPVLMVAAVWPPLFRPAALGAIDHHGGIIFFTVSLLALATWALGEGKQSLESRGKRIRFVAVLSLAVAGSILTWLGFVLILAFLGAFFFVHSMATGGKYSAATVSTGTAFLVASLVILPFGITNPIFTFTYLSLFQVSFLAAIGVALLAVDTILRRFKPRLVLAVVSLNGVVIVLVVAAFLLFPRLYDLVSTGLIKTFGLYPWAQETSEWKPLLFPNEKFAFTTATGLYGNAIYLLPIAVLLVVVWQHRRIRTGPAVFLFYLWSVMSIALAIQVVVFWQFSGPVTAIYLGVGLLALWDFITSRFQPLSDVFRSSVFPAAFPLIVMFTLLVGLETGRMIRPTYTSNFHDLLTWIRENTPPTGYFSDNTRQPEYGIVSNWEYGDAIAGAARRPAVVDGNNETNLAGFVLEQSILQSRDEDEVIRLMEENSIRYAVVGPHFAYYDGDLWQAGPPESLTARSRVPKLKTKNNLPDDYASQITFARLYAVWEDPGIRPLQHFRLVHIGTDGKYPIYVYERVMGASITGKATPGKRVYAALTFSTTGGRTFVARYETIAGSDSSFQFILPYSTSGKMGDSMAIDGYTITDWQNTTILQVTEEKVKNGDQLYIDLTSVRS